MREGGGFRRSADVVLPGQEGRGVRFYKVVGGQCVARCGGGGGMAASRSSSQGWMFGQGGGCGDGRAALMMAGRQCYRAGGYKCRCWSGLCAAHLLLLSVEVLWCGF